MVSNPSNVMGFYLILFSVLVIFFVVSLRQADPQSRMSYQLSMRLIILKLILKEISQTHQGGRRSD
jgi:hypothetical protein